MMPTKKAITEKLSDLELLGATVARTSQAACRDHFLQEARHPRARVRGLQQAPL